MSKNNPGVARQAGRAFTINAIASAGSVVGLFGAFAVISKFTDKDKKSKES